MDLEKNGKKNRRRRMMNQVKLNENNLGTKITWLSLKDIHELHTEIQYRKMMEKKDEQFWLSILRAGKWQNINNNIKTLPEFGVFSLL